MNKRFLILCSSEINYNPRLLKAADYLQAHGQKVSVFNAVTGISSYDLYSDVIGSREWKVIENRIDKSSFSSKLRWLYSSLVNLAVRFAWKHFSWELGSKYFMQKGLVMARVNPRDYDFVIIHLIDSLPFAVSMKRRNKNLKIIYDSQEYFRGQYEHEQPETRKWVHATEAKYIGEVSVVLATTEVMRKRIMDDYAIQVPMLRVRNLPYKRRKLEMATEQTDPVLKIVWHGMTIIYGNRRGLQTIVNAVAECKTPVHLYLQGLKRERDMQVLMSELDRLQIRDKVTVVPSAHPDRIVESLESYDVGICAEIPEEENQRLTSSNKLFEYLGAGLCGIVSDVPGLTETLNEFEVGRTFTPGDATNLAAVLDELNSDRKLLLQYKNNARKAAANELYWEHDYDPLYEVLQQLTSAAND